MAQLAAAETVAPGQILRSTDKPVKILAKTLYRDLRSNGYDDRQIVALSTELISLLTSEMTEKDDGQ